MSDIKCLIRIFISWSFNLVVIGVAFPGGHRVGYYNVLLGCLNFVVSREFFMLQRYYWYRTAVNIIFIFMII